MMHQLTGKGKFYLYLFLLIILLSIHNINLRDSLNKFFKVKNIGYGEFKEYIVQKKNSLPHCHLRKVSHQLID